jgi:hypothetical protein
VEMMRAALAEPGPSPASRTYPADTTSRCSCCFLQPNNSKFRQFAQSEIRAHLPRPLILKSGILGKSRAVLPRRTSPPVPPVLSGAYQARFSSTRRTAGGGIRLFGTHKHERTSRRPRPAKLITKTHNENILCSAIGS